MINKEQLIKDLELEVTESLKDKNLHRYNKLKRQIRAIKNGGIERFNANFGEEFYDYEEQLKEEKEKEKEKEKERESLGFTDMKLISAEDWYKKRKEGK